MIDHVIDVYCIGMVDVRSLAAVGVHFDCSAKLNIPLLAYRSTCVCPNTVQMLLMDLSFIVLGINVFTEVILTRKCSCILHLETIA